MRSRAAALLLLLATGCGDDERVGGRPATPPATPAATPADGTSPAAPPVAGAPATPAATRPRAGGPEDPWAATRVGDTATWEVRVEGEGVRTRITWGATRVEPGVVAYEVTSSTTGADGAVLASQSSSEAHAAASAAPPRLGTERREFDVGGRKVTARSAEADGPGGRVSLWVSSEVPFHGIVRSAGAGVEQTLVSFERAPR
jgi:hypothetical protein